MTKKRFFSTMKTIHLEYQFYGLHIFVHKIKNKEIFTICIIHKISKFKGEVVHLKKIML